MNQVYMRHKHISLLSLLLPLLFAPSLIYAAPLDAASLVSDWNRRIVEVIMEDGFSPAVGSRIYTYANIAAYESVRGSFPGYRSVVGQVDALKDLPVQDPALRYDQRV